MARQCGTRYQRAGSGNALALATRSALHASKNRRCKQAHETEASDDEDDSVVEQYFKRIKTDYAAILANVNNDKNVSALVPPAASNLLTVIKQTSHVPNNSPTQNNNNTGISSFSAKRSQLQARLACGIFNRSHKKMRVNAETPNSFSSILFNSSVERYVLNPDTSHPHQGSVATGSLGAHEAPELNSMQRGPNENDSHIIFS